MNARMVLISVALAAGLLGGCDRTKLGDPAKPVVPKTGSAEMQPQISPTAAANSTEKSRTPPIQGQVDTKEPVQKKDFETNK